MKKTLLLFALFNLTCTYAQIENGMTAHFPFGGNCNDISNSAIVGNNNGGTYGLDRNNATNSAIQLNGTSSYVSFNSNTIKTAFPISISAWVKVDAFHSTYAMSIFLSDEVYNDYHGYMLGVLPSGKLDIRIGGGAGGASPNNRRSFTTNNSISTGTWHHIVAIIRDYNDIEIHVDCQNLTGSYNGAGPTSIAYSSSVGTIGKDAGSSGVPPGSFFNGSIDQLIIWNREITPGEITTLCNVNNTLAIDELKVTSKELVKIIDLLGRETKATKNTPLIYVYSDGSSERVFEMD